MVRVCTRGLLGGGNALAAFFFSSSRRHTSCLSDWSSDVCSSDLRGLVHKLRLAVTPPHPDSSLRSESDPGSSPGQALSPHAGRGGASGFASHLAALIRATGRLFARAGALLNCLGQGLGLPILLDRQLVS